MPTPRLRNPPRRLQTCGTCRLERVAFVPFQTSRYVGRMARAEINGFPCPMKLSALVILWRSFTGVLPASAMRSMTTRSSPNYA